MVAVRDISNHDMLKSTEVSSDYVQISILKPQTYSAKFDNYSMTMLS